MGGPGLSLALLFHLVHPDAVQLLMPLHVLVLGLSKRTDVSVDATIDDGALPLWIKR